MKRPIVESLFYFLSVRKIDTYQKLRLILFLHKHPQTAGTCQEFAKKLHLADTVFLERIVADLEAVDLIIQADNRYCLSSDPDVRQYLGELSKAYDDPVARQDIIRQVNNKRSSEGKTLPSATV